MNTHQIDALETIALALAEKPPTKKKGRVDPRIEKARAIIKDFPTGHHKGIAHIVGLILDIEPSEIQPAGGMNWKKGQAVMVLSSYGNYVGNRVAFAYRDYTGTTDPVVQRLNTGEFRRSDDIGMPHTTLKHTRYATADEIKAEIAELRKLAAGAPASELPF